MKNQSASMMKISLARMHLNEWKSLLLEEMDRRHKLGVLHQIERNQLLESTSDPDKIAELIEKQLLDICKLKEINQEYRVILRDKQFRETNSYD